MKRCKHEDLAKTLADEDKAFYGFCIFDGWFYIGAMEQLAGLGCLSIKGQEVTP